MRPLLALVLALSLAYRAGAMAGPVDGPDLLLEVRLGKHAVSDGLGAYQHGGRIYLPLGELARLLTIAVRADPAARLASGYILAEQRGFRLDLATLVVLREGRSESVDPALVLLRADDVYVEAGLLARWLPIDLQVDMASLLLTVVPREKLPLQARLERQGTTLRPGPEALRDFPRMPLPYAMAETPFVDQTLGVEHRRVNGRRNNALRYAGFASGDLLGMEAALYVSHGNHFTDPSARFTLARHDPDAGLLGPLRARSVQIGSVSAPGLAHVAHRNVIGTGVQLSNRPLSQPSRFDRHTFEGDLAPGWDVELYYNDALVAVAQAGPEGRYRFEDQPLNYGANDFRLVFHGPLGQLRVERHSFLLEQSLLAPGALHYSASLLRVARGEAHAQAQLDMGLGRQLSASAALTKVHGGEHARAYASVGLHGFWGGFIGTGSLVRSTGQGKLAQLGVKTRVSGVAVGASRAWSDNFVSELYLPGANAVRVRDEIGVDGVLGMGLALPMALLARRDRLVTGPQNIEVNGRVAAYRFSTAFTQALRWQSQAGRKHADAATHISRRIAGVGLSAQLYYTLKPDTALSSLALAADRHLDNGYLVNAGVSRSFQDPQLRFHAGLSRTMGRFGFGVGTWYGRREGLGAGFQLFLALGRDPRRGQWLLDAAPMAGAGSASLRVFLDKNRNGVHDGSDEAVPAAGFLVNGSGNMARTDAQGLAWLGRLAPNLAHDIAVDPATLEDPRWQARLAGVRLVARPGKTGQLDFPIGITGEIDGTTYLVSHGVRRGVGDFEVELVDPSGRVVATTTSSSDGYYVLGGVNPGNYLLRLAPAQLARLGVAAPPPLKVTMDEEGNFLNGKDFVVRQ